MILAANTGLNNIFYLQMLRYHHILRDTSNSNKAQAIHKQIEHLAMARSSALLSSGIGHIFSLAKAPFATYRDATGPTEVLSNETTCCDSGEDDESLDRQAVEQELRRYEEDGLSDVTSLVAFWEVGFITPMSQRHFLLTWTLSQEHKCAYPVLFHLAMDILPAQATVVPCERVFSSSKETCMLHRSQLGPITFEILQVLKYLYQRERLDFTTGILAKEEDYTIEGPVTELAVLELLKAGKVEELQELYTNWSIQIQSD